MATYEYQARTGAGERVSGLVQADSETAAIRALDERELYPVRVGLQRRARQTGGRIRLRDIGVMYGQLGDLLRAGLPLLRALETISRAGVSERLKASLRKVGEGVSAGRTLADALGEQPGVFPSLHIAMIRAGEKAGFLEDVLTNLSDFIERVDELRSKIHGAMIYPLVLTVVALSVTGGMLVWFVPRFKTMFSGRALPLPTRIMFSLSDALLNGWPILLGGLVVVVLLLSSLIKSEWGGRVWERWRLKIPVVGRVIRTISITRFCRILGTMLANGVPILQALAISKDATGSAILADSIEEAAESVRAGETLTDPLRASKLIPPQILEMVAVAEESNQLDRVLVEIAETVERRTDRQVDQAVHLIEPVILVFMAIMIGTLAVGLVYPILTMAQSLK